MDQWLAAIEADTSSNPIEVKVVNHKPAGAVDFCLTTTGATDAQLAPMLALDDPAVPRQARDHAAAGRRWSGGGEHLQVLH